MSNFRILTTEQLLKELDRYKFKQLHIHHTWKPEHKDFKGNNHIAMQQGMYNYHTKTLGWQDIGQHLSLFPDGKWVTGRPFNITPASIKGWNTGALAVEMIGNFDIGHDALGGKQKENILKLVKYFIDKYGEGSIKFHREGPGVAKTCPGTSLNKAKLIQDAKNLGKVNKMANKKEDNTPSTWAKEGWEWAKKEGYLDGKRPKEPITREEMAIVIKRLVDKIG
ncbi:N-acetylmuramoyl-L-alanine amidase [Anaerosalibacter sp. Marseille-P3206]|uniref:N-acetylmuramoyl-L-alanine amidase n=1 Tax=Anaerosalibacter sp. Marseille-P3206 TaxID=1871005 RepID=UPI0013563538|nr:N-acetylmuramoyl-L-alanine amidase [Anaerosalibacter sp. Marseille-P3206]